MKKSEVLISLIAIAMTSALTFSCRSPKPQAPATENDENVVVGFDRVPQPDQPLTGYNNFIPKAQVYRTNGDYNHNVPIQVNAAGTQLISFPAPTDLTLTSIPIPLADGYLLDRRGISPFNTRFTNFTYSQYSALEQPPTPETLLKAIIPNALVIDFVTLPITMQEALADTSAVNNLIRTGFPGCDVMLQSPVERP